MHPLLERIAAAQTPEDVVDALVSGLSAHARVNYREHGASVRSAETESCPACVLIEQITHEPSSKMLPWHDFQRLLGDAYRVDIHEIGISRVVRGVDRFDDPLRARVYAALGCTEPR